MKGLKICLNCRWFSEKLKLGERIYVSVCRKNENIRAVGRFYACKNFIFKEKGD